MFHWMEIHEIPGNSARSEPFQNWKMPAPMAALFKTEMDKRKHMAIVNGVCFVKRIGCQIWPNSLGWLFLYLFLLAETYSQGSSVHSVIRRNFS